MDTKDWTDSERAEWGVLQERAYYERGSDIPVKIIALGVRIGKRQAAERECVKLAKGPKIRWGKFKQWHAWVFFDGYVTQGGVCSAVGKTNPPKDLLAGPDSTGVQGICRSCAYGVLGINKRYGAARSPEPE